MFFEDSVPWTSLPWSSSRQWALSPKPLGADGLPLPLQIQRRWQPLPGELCQGGWWVHVSGRCLYTSVCGREGIRLVYPLQTLGCPKYLVGVACGVLQNPTNWQQTPESCWNLTWSLLDFKVWLATQFHGLQLFIYLYSALLLSALLWCSELQREIQVLKSV